MFRKEFGNSCILGLKFSDDSDDLLECIFFVFKKSTGNIGYLARSAALNPAPATIIVCGVPFFLDADQSLVGFLLNFSRKAGRFSKVLG